MKLSFFASIFFDDNSQCHCAHKLKNFQKKMSYMKANYKLIFLLLKTWSSISDVTSNQLAVSTIFELKRKLLNSSISRACEISTFLNLSFF